MGGAAQGSRQREETDKSWMATYITHHVMLKPYDQLSFEIRENLCL
jgi:hypothetical protein